MPTLSATISKFDGPLARINGPRVITISKRQLLKFAMSIGLPILRAASPTSKHAVALAMYKSLAIKCAVDFTSGSLTRPRQYDRMDQSEKANISYWTGMVFAALLADEVLGVPRLIHAAAFGRLRLARVNPKSRRLADLVGQDNAGAWHVIEAKARQAAASQAVRDEWKNQAETVATIDGVPPTTCSYSFTRVGRTYSAELVDPKSEKKRQPIKIDFAKNAILKGYYATILEWLSEESSTIERGQERLVIKRAAFDPESGEFVFFGMTVKTKDAVSHNELPWRQKSQELKDAYIGSDGLAVATSSKTRIA